MSRRLPSLTGLRAFEAVFRCGGIAQAAADLAVTPSAISHQIRQLEEDMNVKLVRRDGRRIVQTAAGSRLCPPLRDAFRSLTAAVADVYEQETAAPLRISMLQNFGVNWFLPNLHYFQGAFSNIEVRVSFESHYVDFAREQVDMAVRHSIQPWPALHCEFLFQDQLLPACSKSFLAAHGPFREPTELLRHPLLVSDGRPHDAWTKWFEAAGVKPSTELRTIHVDTSHLAMLAAANGIGFVIAGARMMEPMMRRGELVSPYPLTVPEHGSFFIVCPPAWANRPKVRRMRHWLVEEFARQSKS